MLTADADFIQPSEGVIMTHEEYMRAALALAGEAGAAGDVPVGCVVVSPEGEIIGRGKNERQAKNSAVAHAEVEAIEEACRRLGTWRLQDCSLYVTLEPCPMCAGAIMNARIKRVYYGARETRSGSCGSVINLFMENYEFSPQVVGGVLEDECAALMTDFFKELR